MKRILFRIPMLCIITRKTKQSNFATSSTTVQDISVEMNLFKFQKIPIKQLQEFTVSKK